MNNNITISEAFSYYERAEIIAGGLSRKTAETYYWSAKLAVDYFGDIPLGQIDAEDVRCYYEHLMTWQAPDTARGHICCLRAVVRLCRRWGLECLDPDFIKLPKRQKREIHYLTEAEVERFISALGQKRRGYSAHNRLRNVAMVEVLYASGLRVSELCKLNRGTIRERQFSITGKSKAPRLCFINRRAERAIKRYLKIRTDGNPALFVSQSGRRVTPHGVREAFRQGCAWSGMANVHPHTIRHSFATKLLAKEVDIRYIADLMGHESLDTTKHYTHFTNPKLKRIYRGAMD